MKIPLTRPEKAKRLDRQPYQAVTTVQDVLAISAALRAANIPFYLHGGWALAALCSTIFQSSDVDLYIPLAYEKTVHQHFGSLVGARARRRIMLNFHGAIIEISFITPLRHNRWMMDYGNTIWVIPNAELVGHHVTLADREIPSVSTCFIYAELTNTVRKKPSAQNKHTDRLPLADAILSTEERGNSRALWPLPGTFLNRLRLAITG